MIPFLVKLANLLDERGQHSMAREVDDLIEKIAQATWADSWVANNKKLKGLFANLKELATLSGNKQVSQILDSSMEWVDALSQANLNDKTIDQGNEWWNYLGTNVFKPLEAAINAGKMSGDRYYQIKEQMTPVLNEIAQYSGNVKDQLARSTPPAAKEQTETGVASKVPAAPVKKKTQPSKQSMDLVRLIQNAIGAPEVNGKWTAETNQAFIKYMNENYPIAMKNNRFVGPVVDDKGTRGGNTLKDAWELIKEKQSSQQQLAQETANKAPAEQTGQASKAPAAKPAAPAQKWTSKFFKITPQLQGLLSQWEAARGKGQAQTLLDAFDKSPGQTQQSLEAFIKENMNA